MLNVINIVLWLKSVLTLVVFGTSVYWGESQGAPPPYKNCLEDLKISFLQVYRIEWNF